MEEPRDGETALPPAEYQARERGILQRGAAGGIENPSRDAPIGVTGSWAGRPWAGCAPPVEAKRRASQFSAPCRLGIPANGEVTLVPGRLGELAHRGSNAQRREQAH